MQYYSIYRGYAQSLPQTLCNTRLEKGKKYVQLNRTGSLLVKNFWTRELRGARGAAKWCNVKISSVSGTCKIFLKKSVQDKNFDKTSFDLRWLLKDIQINPEVKASSPTPPISEMV